MVLKGLEWYVRDVKAPGWAGSAEGRGWAGEVEARKVAPRKILCLARGAKLFENVCPKEWATIDRVYFVCTVIDFISCCEGRLLDIC